MQFSTLNNVPRKVEPPCFALFFAFISGFPSLLKVWFMGASMQGRPWSRTGVEVLRPTHAARFVSLVITASGSSRHSQNAPGPLFYSPS